MFPLNDSSVIQWEAVMGPPVVTHIEVTLRALQKILTSLTSLGEKLI